MLLVLGLAGAVAACVPEGAGTPRAYPGPYTFYLNAEAEGDAQTIGFIPLDPETLQAEPAREDASSGDPVR